MTHSIPHKIHRSAPLRAAVLGANDGIVSTACLIVGLASTAVTDEWLLLASIAAVIAGAISMAVGEFVSVGSQLDLEKAELEIEKESLEQHWHAEVEELADIYVKRGVNRETAVSVAQQLMAHDALTAHAKEDIGIDPEEPANPIQAALYSAFAFLFGAFVPLMQLMWIDKSQLFLYTIVSSLICLGVLGGLAAYAGGGNVFKGVSRVVIFAGTAMLLSMYIGDLASIVL
jgi:VIT1/CCC1 family predicted Fe2+/Mn2+ transporter